MLYCFNCNVSLRSTAWSVLSLMQQGRLMVRTWFLLFLLVAFVACEGNLGPSLNFDVPANMDLAKDDMDAVGDRDILDEGDLTPRPDSDVDRPDSTKPDADIAPDPDTDPGDVTILCKGDEHREIACGLNARGIQKQRCIDDHWVNQGDCIDPDICQDGLSNYTPCGLNYRGMIEIACIDGQFEEGPCVDPDVCVDGDDGIISCGLNNRGRTNSVCVEGQWVSDICDDPDECVDDDRRTTSCGTGDKGEGDQNCVAGHWVNDGGCRISGSWCCSNRKCQPTFGAYTCGNGACEPVAGESPQSCPVDCALKTGPNGEGTPCTNAFDCFFYDWPLEEQGLWECSEEEGNSKVCKAKVSVRSCGNGTCELHPLRTESAIGCPRDCPPKTMACGYDVNCVFHPWPTEDW